MLTQWLPAAALQIGTHLCIFIGIAFGAGKFLPQQLHQVYTWLPTTWGRSMLAAVTIVLLGNYLVGLAYKNYPAQIVGTLHLFCAVTSIIVMAVLIDKIAVSPKIAMISLALALLAGWLGYELNNAPTQNTEQTTATS